MSERLASKVALITGASSGIGAATARAFVAEGAKVALVARRPEPLEELVAELGDTAVAVPADVGKPAEARAAVAATIERLGGLDVVVNSAGVCWPVSLEDVDDEHWQQVIDVNVSGSFWVSRDAGLYMRERGGGTIINIGSDMALNGAEQYVSYCASKAAIIGLSRSLAAELAPTVTVNTICPGKVDTPMLTAEFESSGDLEAARRETIEAIPLKRLGRPNEVAAGILYLAADAGFATGATLELDGGTTVP